MLCFHTMCCIDAIEATFDCITDKYPNSYVCQRVQTLWIFDQNRAGTPVSFGPKSVVTEHTAHRVDRTPVATDGTIPELRPGNFGLDLVFEP